MPSETLQTKPAPLFPLVQVGAVLWHVPRVAREAKLLAVAAHTVVGWGLAPTS